MTEGEVKDVMRGQSYTADIKYLRLPNGDYGRRAQRIFFLDCGVRVEFDEDGLVADSRDEWKRTPDFVFAEQLREDGNAAEADRILEELEKKYGIK